MSYVGESNKKMESLMLSMQLHLRHLMALGGQRSHSGRSRCSIFSIGRLLIMPQARPDLLRETEKLAEAVGGRLQTPRLWTARYAFVQKMFGWNAAKRVHTLIPRMRAAGNRFWDKACFKLEKQNS